MSICFWNKNTHQETVLGGISGIFDRIKAGLVPPAPSGSGTSKYIREDGNWEVPPDTKYPKAIKNITRSGLTFTATCYDDTTFTFTQQDNNTTYESKAAASGGTAVSLCTTGEKYNWTHKCDYTVKSFGSSSESFTANTVKTYNITGPSTAGTYLVMVVNLVNESHSIYDLTLSIGGRSYIGSATRVLSTPPIKIAALSANQTMSVNFTAAETLTRHLTGDVLFLRLA